MMRCLNLTLIFHLCHWNCAVQPPAAMPLAPATPWRWCVCPSIVCIKCSGEWCITRGSGWYVVRCRVRTTSGGMLSIFFRSHFDTVLVPFTCHTPRRSWLGFFGRICSKLFGFCCCSLCTSFSTVSDNYLKLIHLSCTHRHSPFLLRNPVAPT